jgi:hypothetical protein
VRGNDINDDDDNDNDDEDDEEDAYRTNMIPPTHVASSFPCSTGRC